MLVLMRADHRQEDVDRVVEKIKAKGFKSHIIPGDHSVAIGITGNSGALSKEEFEALPGVEEAIRVTRSYKLAGREFHAGSREITVGGVTFRDGAFVVMAGPCAVESEEQTLRIARKIKEAGVPVMRGGAFKPRSSPYSFQGLGEEGLKILAKAREETGLPVVTEALDSESLRLVADYADIIQIGTRNMQNFSLLQEVGKAGKPCLLKRGFSATIDEWLMAAEYILDSGNPDVILCERGLRGFDPHTRNLLDITAVPVAKELSRLPVVIDPSHSAGRRTLVDPICRAALAIGASGVLVDVHDRPDEALVDGPQAILPDELNAMMATLKRLAGALEIDLPVK